MRVHFVDFFSFQAFFSSTFVKENPESGECVDKLNDSLLEQVKIIKCI